MPIKKTVTHWETCPLEKKNIIKKENCFKQSTADLNSEFPFSRLVAVSGELKSHLANYKPIAEGKIVGCIAFPGVLTLCEIQTASSRIWIRVTKSISSASLKEWGIYSLRILQPNLHT